MSVSTRPALLPVRGPGSSPRRSSPDSRRSRRGQWRRDTVPRCRTRTARAARVRHDAGARPMRVCVFRVRRFGVEAEVPAVVDQLHSGRDAVARQLHGDSVGRGAENDVDRVVPARGVRGSHCHVTEALQVRVSLADRVADTLDVDQRGDLHLRMPDSRSMMFAPPKPPAPITRARITSKTPYGHFPNPLRKSAGTARVRFVRPWHQPRGSAVSRWRLPSRLGVGGRGSRRAVFAFHRKSTARREPRPPGPAIDSTSKRPRTTVVWHCLLASSGDAAATANK